MTLPFEQAGVDLNRLLTGRQRELLALIGEGYKNREIGRRLGLKERTVERHVGDIMNALGIDYHHGPRLTPGRAGCGWRRRFPQPCMRDSHGHPSRPCVWRSAQRA